MSKLWIPREYQPPVIEHIINNPRCAVWAEMGLGKTVSTLSALDILYLTSEESRPTLICAPLRVAKNTWPCETAKWNHLKHIEILPIVGSKQDRFHALFTGLKKGNASVFTINYENLPWLQEVLEETRTVWPFGTVIADESSKLKGFRLRQGTLRAKCLAKVAHRHVSRFVQLTGTPSPNGLKDLWGQIWFLDAGKRLGKSFDAFSTRWFRKGYDGFSIEPLPHAQQEIMAILKDICLSIRSKDYFNLKEPIVTNVEVNLPSKAYQVYRNMENKMFAELEAGDIEAANAAAKTMKLLQIANGFAYFEGGKEWEIIHDEKLHALEDIAEEAAGMPVLVAYHFKPDLERLKKKFPQGRYFDDKQKTQDDWNAGKIPVMFIHPDSGGHGLNLQDGGNIIAFYGHWWNLETYQQVIERIGPNRQFQSGYDRPVFIYHIVAKDTIDELVIESRNSKKEVQEILMEAMKRRRENETMRI